jgi:Zn-dependent peptidase ImmA (M78 family)
MDIYNHTSYEHAYQNVNANSGDTDEYLSFIASALNAMPKEVALQAIEECVFYTFSKDELGRFFHADQLARRHVVLINSELFEIEDDEMEDKIVKTIMHELAHFWLGHKLEYDSETRISYFKDGAHCEKAAERVAADWFETREHIQEIQWKLWTESAH